MNNALTIDVEDYFHVAAFEECIRTEDWDNYPLRVVDNTLKVLDILDEFSIKATFFVLGWVAERSPALVKEIQKRGHEIACHGYWHKLIYRIGPDKFKEDVRKSRLLLEDLCGHEIRGFRAPSYSITKDSIWALDILIEEGFLYDSSIFPINHDIYGIPDADRFPHDINRTTGVIKEFPLSTFELRLNKYELRVPISGGGYLRLLPAWLIKKAINNINENEGKPAVIYFHPWEIDNEQPRIKAGFKSRVRHYINIDKTLQKVKYLLASCEFSPMMDVLGFKEDYSYKA
jgi:polysaccharide deacetylase family protein (PEP-CTERM system associated)